MNYEMGRLKNARKNPSNSRFLSRYPLENKKARVKIEVKDHSFRQLYLIASNP